MRNRLNSVWISLSILAFVSSGHSDDGPQGSIPVKADQVSSNQGPSNSDQAHSKAQANGSENNSAAPKTGATEPTPPKKLYKGKVVRMIDGLKRRGIKAYADDMKHQTALETTTGELIPILPDWRGRAFSQDDHLRDRNVELIGFQRKGVPFLNVLSVYTFDEKGRRQYTDYWCDVCSIPMYEIKPCDCCQQEIRLRFELQELPKNVEPAEVP